MTFTTMVREVAFLNSLETRRLTPKFLTIKDILIYTNFGKIR